jgi:hypothetical protein
MEYWSNGIMGVRSEITFNPNIPVFHHSMIYRSGGAP